MVKEYLINHIKNNKTISSSIIVISFLTTLLLSVLNSMFYNLYVDYVARGENAATMTIALYILVIIVSSVALMLMLYNVFAISMNSRIHQLGILKSIGATKKQIKTLLVLEILYLSILPILIGAFVGIVFSYFLMTIIIQVGESFRDYNLTFAFHPFVVIISIAISFIIVFASASIPARKISKISVLDSIFYKTQKKLKKIKKYLLISELFGVEGELARKSVYEKRKTFRIASFALILASLGFITFLNLETISGIFTKMTYFEKYKDAWDIMFQIENPNENLTEELREIDGVQSVISYYKYNFYTDLGSSYFSDDVNEIGIDTIAQNIEKNENNTYKIKIPIIVLDNISFKDYYQSIRESNFYDSPIVINKIWNSKNNNLLGKYIPFVNENNEIPMLLYENNKNETFSILVSEYAENIPNLKEEYYRNDNELVLIMSENYARNLNDKIMSTSPYFTIKVKNIENIDKVQSQIEEKLDLYNYEIQNRIKEENDDKEMRSVLRLIIGIFASILACIGIANVFSNSLGLITQRKREFARYISLGLSRKGLKRILLYEAIIMSIKPIIISLIINIPIILISLNASTLVISDFIPYMPIKPILIYILFILASISFVYYIGGKKILNTSIVEMLKDDSQY